MVSLHFPSGSSSPLLLSKVLRVRERNSRDGAVERYVRYCWKNGWFPASSGLLLCQPHTFVLCRGLLQGSFGRIINPSFTSHHHISTGMRYAEWIDHLQSSPGVVLYIIQKYVAGRATGRRRLGTNHFQQALCVPFYYGYPRQNFPNDGSAERTDIRNTDGRSL